jgi:hypothetical protein
MKDVVLELVKKMLTKDGSFKLVLALNSVLYRVSGYRPLTLQEARDDERMMT